MLNIAIREAAEADAAILLEVEQAAFAVYQAILDPPPSVFRETPEVIRQKMAHGIFLAAWGMDQIVGMVFYQRNDDHVYLGRLCTLPAWQGYGVARTLMQIVEERAVQLGMPVVQLGVRLALPQLIATYQRYGYQIVAERCHPGYVNPTFVTMQKRLVG